MEAKKFLGRTVHDITSGFKGTATQYLEYLNGNVQVALQPKMAEGATTMPDAMFIDQHMLEIIDEGIADRVAEVTNPSPIKLGEEVVDEITGFTGIATMKTTYINGCENFYVEQKHQAKDKHEVGRWLAAIRIKRKGAGKAPAIEAKRQDKPTGCAPLRVPHQRAQR